MEDKEKDTAQVTRNLVYAESTDQTKSIDTGKAKWHDELNLDERMHLNEARNLVAI